MPLRGAGEGSRSGPCSLWLGALRPGWNLDLNFPSEDPVPVRRGQQW